MGEMGASSTRIWTNNLLIQSAMNFPSTKTIPLKWEVFEVVFIVGFLFLFWYRRSKILYEKGKKTKNGKNCNIMMKGFTQSIFFFLFIIRSSPSSPPTVPYDITMADIKTGLGCPLKKWPHLCSQVSQFQDTPTTVISRGKKNE